MVVRAHVVVVALFALLCVPALAQDGGQPDGGALDGGDGVEDDGGVRPDDDAGFSGDCTPTCDGELLRFCDDGEPVALDCTETGATCGLLSDEWGFDCVLPAGADCDPGYAEGLSRCDGAGDATRCCVDDVCGDPGEANSCRRFAPGTPAFPEEPGSTDEPPAAASCLGLGGCEGIPLLSFLPLIFGLRLLRRRREPR